MNIKHPELIALWILLPALATFLYYTWQRQKKVLKQLCDFSKLANIFPRISREKTVLRFLLVFIAFSMTVTALISPRWGYDWKEVETQGANIIIALDVSKSMLATDITPSRLVRAKYELIKLIEKLTGDRLGLIIFAGDSFLQSPLTHDYLMVRDWIARLNVDSVATPGTSIKSAIQTARKAFKFVESEAKALIIISDGEEHDEATIEEAKTASREGIKVYTIGVGTAKGAPIQLSTGLIKDKDGNVVVSKLDDTLLKELAEATDGIYVRSSGGDFHLDTLYYDNIKHQLSDEVLKSGKTKKWYETFQVFMSIALFALVFDFLLSLDLGIYSFFKSLFTRRKDNIFYQKKK